MSTNDDPRSIQTLLAIMARLRNPETGCPWDIEQTFATIAPYTLEEAYEVADAIERGDMDQLRDELGDLLFQVVFHSRMAEEAGAFAFADVVGSISEKMLRRHPHVFGDADVKTADAQTAAWEEHKRKERQAKGGGVMDDIPVALPALTRALKIQKRAATVGFDWKEARPIFDKLDEEVGELRAAMAENASKEKLADELGDILFVVVNIARHLGLKPEDALAGTNRKFLQRFAFVEAQARNAGKALSELTLEEMEAAWTIAKSLERNLA
ncbi:MAG: nucleoside triphosphate pyrophosphohydrolase [Alphaproteobacteria bacterium]|nr:nucleoside triphosphate pyrophosphohydrolase [Alphaproteobacteria bacterium]